MRNYKLTLEYDGGEFSGWQIQPDQRTVQGELYRALERLGGGDTLITGAGRTDAGVHATGQVASVRIDTRLSADELMRAVNASLPGDIIVKRSEEVPLYFNARFDARSRSYRYLFIRRRSAIWRKHFYLYGGPLDTSVMQREARSLIGEHDFSSFCSSTDACNSKRCIVLDAGVINTPPLLTFHITADHFLHNMVRALAGTLLEIGKGKPLIMKEIIEAADRAAAGPTLPPHGLYLVEVRYATLGGPSE
jgi:tRNA pseudouridine38-40 synthase